MKKMSNLNAVILGVFLLASGISYSQSIAYQKPESKWLSENSFTGSVSDPGDEAAAVNPRSIETFKKMFSDVHDVKWTKMGKNHDRAFFQNDAMTVRAGFDKKGRSLYVIRYYNEENLPDDILYLVKSTYYGKSIFGVLDVTVDGKTAYFVHLQDKTSWLKVKILNGEITEEQAYLKR